MRLKELEPQWLGGRSAIIFLCPHCRNVWLTCFFVPMGTLPRLTKETAPHLDMLGSRGERAWFYKFFKERGHSNPAHSAYSEVVACGAGLVWNRTSDDFEAMSVTPSIDASASGHWHGFIKSGGIA